MIKTIFSFFLSKVTSASMRALPPALKLFIAKLRAALIPKKLRIQLHLLRISKPVTSLLGPRYLSNFNRIELDITYNCNLRCLNCNKSCGENQAPSTEQMSYAQIEEFIRESITEKKKWKEIAIVGGEPTCHPGLSKIINLICEYRKYYLPEVRIEFFTNGLGENTQKILAALPKEITVRNSEKTSTRNYFVAFNLAPVDDMCYRNADFTNGCGMTSCGICLGLYGYYFCTVAGCIDRVIGLDIGLKKLPLKENRAFMHQRALLCRYCGYFKGVGSESAAATEVSDFWIKTYQQYQQVPPVLSCYAALSTKK